MIESVTFFNYTLDLFSVLYFNLLRLFNERNAWMFLEYGC